jgi:hypothetical protein
VERERNWADRRRDRVELLEGLVVAEPFDGDERGAHLSPLGQLSALMGDRRRSEGHFSAGLSQCREIGARTLRARAQIAYAKALLEFGDAAAKRKAERLRADAADTAMELGMHAITRRLAESG